MIGEYKKKPICITCKFKVLEEEFVESHKALGHNVEHYVFGGYQNQGPEEKKNTEKLNDNRKNPSNL